MGPCVENVDISWSVTPAALETFGWFDLMVLNFAKRRKRSLWKGLADAFMIMVKALKPGCRRSSNVPRSERPGKTWNTVLWADLRTPACKASVYVMKESMMKKTLLTGN